MLVLGINCLHNLKGASNNIWWLVLVCPSRTFKLDSQYKFVQSSCYFDAMLSSNLVLFKLRGRVGILGWTKGRILTWKMESEILNYYLDNYHDASGYPTYHERWTTDCKQFMIMTTMNLSYRNWCLMKMLKWMSGVVLWTQLVDRNTGSVLRF